MAGRSAVESNIKVDKRWFQDRMADADVTQRRVAEELGIDPSAMTNLLNGKRNPRVEEVLIMAKTLRVSKEAVLAHMGLQSSAAVPGESSTPVIGWVDDDGVLHEGKVEGPTNMPTPPGVPDGAVAVRYQTGGSFDGWVAFFVPSEYVRPEAFTRLSVVTLKDGAKKLRIVRQGYEEGSFRLTTLAAPNGPAESAVLIAAAPVLWLKQ
jgi:transcriptional regulator with XRE-family HTH domain